jgi:hypothetical protein
MVRSLTDGFTVAGVAVQATAERLPSDPNGLSYLAPAPILHALQPAQVDSGNRQARVDKERADLLDRLPGVFP